MPSLSRTASLAVEVAVQALLLRKQHPSMPAVEVLDEAMLSRHGRWIDFGEIGLPPAPFALLVAEAFDGGMLPCDWVGLLRSRSHPRLRPVLMEVWANEVWPKFVVRYSLYRGGITES